MRKSMRQFISASRSWALRSDSKRSRLFFSFFLFSFSLELLLAIERLKTPTRMLDRHLLDCFLLECLYRSSSETGSFFASVVDRSHKLHQLASSEKYVTLRRGTDCRLNIRDKMVHTMLEFICHRLFEMLTIDIGIDGSLPSVILIVFTN